MAFEQYPTLAQLDWIEHAFTLRSATPKPERHAENFTLRKALPITAKHWERAQQIHGDEVAVIHTKSNETKPAVDALCTNEKEVALILSVADCCAIYAVDPVTHSIGLAHSGSKGTEKNILKSLVTQMTKSFRTKPADLILQLSPCIRFPQYPMDFVSKIKGQARELGISQLHDCEVCTATNLHRYYSYRAEKGQTGRMMAILAIKN